MILAAKRVYVFGFGNSATVCTDMEIRFLRLGLAIRADADSPYAGYRSGLVTPDDVVIAVSHSGATKELLQSVQTAKAAGAGIIVITSHGQSLLAKLADICLCGMGREVQYMSEAGASRLIHMAIGDVLYTRIAMKEKGFFQDNIKRCVRKSAKDESIDLTRKNRKRSLLSIIGSRLFFSEKKIGEGSVPIRRA